MTEASSTEPITASEPVIAEPVTVSEPASIDPVVRPKPFSAKGAATSEIIPASTNPLKVGN